ncbi:lipopolysaccharide biosynthesis protein [Herbaspirillum seropedicae]|uniref:lipopolysaccharide biosynthesis protein n=1 Tax=Herbaspirillum seropedicae TaxID=964 RepID=UPI003FCEC84E
MSILVQLRQSLYLRQVATLLSGSALAQLISLLAAPLLTRLYSPEAFGALALFVALVATLAPGIGGRYEVAVVVASERERRNFFFIALWLTAALCLLFLLVLAAGFAPLSAWLSAGTLGGWLWLAPLALFVTGASTTLRSWANAVKDYRRLSYSAVVQTTSVSVLALALGAAGHTGDGLLLANVTGLVLTCAYLTYVFRDLARDGDWRWDRHKWALALRHKDYPLFNATANILNGVMTGLPVFFLAHHFSEAVVGYYALLMRVGVVPLSFIAEAVSRVNLKKIAELLQAGQDPMPYLRRITLLLLAVAAAPSVLLMLLAPQLFAWVFGVSWGQAGVLLVILMPALAVQFVVSTLSMSFVAAGHLRLQAAWQVLSLLTTLAVFAWAGRSGDINRFFWAYMIKDVVLYVLYYTMLVYALRHPARIHEKG